MTRHRRLPATLLLPLLILLAATPTSLAHGGGDGNAVTAFLTIHTRSTDDGNVTFFTANGEPVANPTLNVSPDRPVVLYLHNLANRTLTVHVGEPVGNATDPIPPGNTSNLAFHVPPNPPARIAYQGEPSREGELQGWFRVEGVEEAQTPLPWMLALAALTGAALVTRAVAPPRA